MDAGGRKHMALTPCLQHVKEPQKEDLARNVVVRRKAPAKIGPTTQPRADKASLREVARTPT